MSSSNPCSNIRSASSTTSISSRWKLKPRVLVRWSTSRPGVATIIFTPTSGVITCNNVIHTLQILSTELSSTKVKMTYIQYVHDYLLISPLSSLSASALRLAPPMTSPCVCGYCAFSMISLRTPYICRDSSLVGEITIAPVPCLRVKFTFVLTKLKLIDYYRTDFFGTISIYITYLHTHK